MPIILLYLPLKFFAVIGIIIALFYVYVLAGDIFLSVFGHEKLEKKRGMIDITNVREMREEIIGALVKYIGGIISFATIYNGLQQIYQGRAFIIYHLSPFPYFDLGSANGVLIKPSTIIRNEKKPLKSGDEIQIGEILLKLLAIDKDETLRTMTVDVKDLMKESREKNQK